MRPYSSLPHEITIDIISRLPPESVGRCRCVCKSWSDLLSRPEFLRDHFTRSRNARQQSLILTYNHASLYYVPLKTAHQLFDEITRFAKKLSLPGYPHSWIQVCGSCDGLLLVRADNGDLFVLNPTTREVRQVSPSPSALDSGRGYTLCGFGNDSVHNDYKIVSLSSHKTDLAFANVYSLKTGTWKSVHCPFYWCCYGPVTPGVLVNGSLHWIANTAPDYAADFDPDFSYEPAIMAFDLAKEKFCQISPPSLVGDTIASNHLAMLGGRLCTFCPRDIDIWVMEEYGIEESWTTLTVENLDELDEFVMRPLCMLGKEEMVLLKDEKEVVVHNLKEVTLKEIVVHSIPKNRLAGESFHESLFSPHGPFHSIRRRE